MVSLDLAVWCERTGISPPSGKNTGLGAGINRTKGKGLESGITDKIRRLTTVRPEKKKR